MLDLLQKNREMLASHSYKVQDEREMLKIDSLANINDYDYYLIACCLCNYPIEEKAEARILRQDYFNKTRGSKIGYEHKPEDYDKKVKTSISCKNTGNINKYGLYEFEINVNDKKLASDLWEVKNSNCLKYVDTKTFEDKMIVSISKDQFNNFTKVLDKLMIQYDIADLESNIFYKNKTSNKLIDISKLSLPFKPYDFQLEDAAKIITKKRFLLGHEMGCGKSFISALVGASLDMPKLVICPPALRYNWYNEIHNVCPDADIQIQLSNESAHFGKDWTIVGYSSVNKFLTELSTFNCLFIDECHFCKAVNNWGKPTSQRAAAVLTIAQKAEYCYLLSGTPEPSHNKDLFNLLKMLKCEEFDFNNQWAFKHFADKYCDPKDTPFGKDYSGNSNSEQLHNILSNLMVRRLKRDVLPHLTKQRQFIPLDVTFKKDYKDIEKRLFEPKPSDTYMGLAMTGRKELSKYKVDAAIELAESLLDADESVVIVTNFVESADQLKAHFGDIACEFRGGMTDLAKEQSKKQFQAGEKKVCILNMQAGGVGITLTAAHTMIIIDYAWVPSDMVQVEDRICRTGQTDNCMIYYLYCIKSTLDTTFIDMISDKSANIDTVVDGSENTLDLSAAKESSATFLDQLKAKIAKSKASRVTSAKKSKKSA